MHSQTSWHNEPLASVLQETEQTQRGPEACIPALTGIEGEMFFKNSLVRGVQPIILAGNPDPRTWMLQQSQTPSMQNTAGDIFLLVDHLWHEAAAPRKRTFNIISLERESVQSTSLALLCQCCRATVWSVQANWTSPRLLALSLTSQSHRKRGFHWWNQVNGYSQISAIIMTGQEMHQWKVTLQAGHCAILYWKGGISLLTFP